MFKEILVICALAACASSLNLKFHCKTDPWHILGDLYTCDGTVESSGSSGDFEKVFVKHTNFKIGNWNTTAFNLQNQRISKIPKKIDDYFPNLIALSFYKSDINTISKYDLQPFGKLEYLGLRDNQISSVPGDFFAYVPLLKDADFSGNKITSIGTRLLDFAPQIKFIHFVSNPCTSISVRNDSNELEKLKEFLKTKC